MTIGSSSMRATTNNIPPLTHKQRPSLVSSRNNITTMQHQTNRPKAAAPMCSPWASLQLLAIGFLLMAGPNFVGAADSSSGGQAQLQQARSTQPSIERQVDTPSSSSLSAPTVVSQQPAPSSPLASAPQAVAKLDSIVSNVAAATVGSKPVKPKQSASSLKKSSLAAQQNYDKYQLKATNSYNNAPAGPDSTLSSSQSSPSHAATPVSNGADKASSSSSSPARDSESKASEAAAAATIASGVAHKKMGNQAAQLANSRPKSSSFSLLKKFLPSFMTSAGPVAAAAAAAASAVADKQANGQHSRSSQSTGDGVLSKASGKIINLLSGTKKLHFGGAVPDHAPFFIRKPSIDRQAGFASGLLSNPLSLGLLFSAPLIPSLLLTPLAIAGLSPAMSAINNFFGDDDETSTPASGPLSSMLSGSSGPLSSLLAQATGSQAGSSSGSSSDSSSAASSPSFALQAMQSLLGPPSSTEKPLFNPGLFASQGIQSAAASLASSSPSGGSSLAGSSSQSSNSPIRNLLGGGSFMQAAASMISPSFASPPSSSSSSSVGSSSSDSDEGPGFMQVASDVFDKVASYMGSGDSSKDLAQASSSTSGSISGANSNLSPLSTLVGLSNFSPFQLSSLLASSPIASAIGSSPSSATSASGSGSSGPQSTQRVGFFSTLRNVYELFSSSFLRRNQEVGDSNECQQRLICELHQRAMNSKLFRRSLQTNLIELANLDKSLQEQIKTNPMQARVDADTKAMLNDFLKATNNFRAGRELVNCSKMYPKCSRAMLLSAANAHLADPVNGKAIGKFSNLMKKMKFKSNQQHQSQWKLRKPGKSVVQQAARLPLVASKPLAVPQVPQYQPADYLQVAPLSPVMGSASGAKTGQLTPADSLKLVQQIMLMSQQQQQQQANQYNAASMQMPTTVQYRQPQVAVAQMQQHSAPQTNQMQNINGQQYSQTYPGYGQYQTSALGQPMSGTTYTDAIAPVYSSSSTDSPYFISSPQQQQQQVLQQQQLNANASISAEMSPQSAQAVPSAASQAQQGQQVQSANPQQHQQQQQQQQQHQQQQVMQMQNDQQNYQTSTSIMPDNSGDMRQQQQPVAKMHWLGHKNYSLI